jgi:hypothetical protein
LSEKLGTAFEYRKGLPVVRAEKRVVMLSSGWLRRSRVGVYGLAFGLLTAPIAAPSATAGSEPWPSNVTATYKITFNGFDIGVFRFQTNIGPQGYTANGDAQISALLGAFTWRGITRVSGAVDAGAPHPAGYTFDFQSSSRSGAIKLGFRQDNITSVSLLPPIEDTEDHVPVREQHLKGVLDPLSAILALARSDPQNPCGRKLSIFDGKQRFDLQMQFRRQERITEARHSGQPDVATVCRVKYTPIAGHRQNDETRAMAASTGIEVSLRHLPSANIMVPHEITIPTGMGPAVLTAQRIEVSTVTNGQIALSQ